MVILLALAPLCRRPKLSAYDPRRLSRRSAASFERSAEWDRKRTDEIGRKLLLEACDAVCARPENSFPRNN
jgi:hypothetical protein